MIDLKDLAGDKYKISMDPSFEFTGVQEDRLWYYRIAGKYGHVYVNSKTELGVYTDGRQRIGMMKQIAGLRIHQVGDREASFVFPPELLDEVAVVLKARKRRPRMSAEQRAAAKERLAKFSFQPKRSPGADSAA